MYTEMKEYVQELFEHHKESIQESGSRFRNRFDHTRRVYCWVERLLEHEKRAGLREKELRSAVIFHDTGYILESVEHAKKSAEIYEKYMQRNQPKLGFTKEETEFARYLIENHSHKEWLEEGADDIPIELILLMEADMLDEEGAMSIIFDCLEEGAKEQVSYEDVEQRLWIYPVHILEKNPMKTEAGKYYWEKKQNLVREFMEQLSMDMQKS